MKMLSSSFSSSSSSSKAMSDSRTTRLAAASPSPRPSPQGRGRIVPGLRKWRAAGLARNASEKKRAFNRCSLSPREKARVRGNGLCKKNFISFGLVTLILFLAMSATAETTNTLSDAEIQGRQLAQQLCNARPAENLTKTGILKFRDGKGTTTEIPVKIETVVTAANWTSIYELSPQVLPTNGVVPIKLTVLHDSANSNNYALTIIQGGDPKRRWTKDRSDFVAILNFAGDFLAADLGLEFFHWPDQKLLKKEFRRNCACMVLESTNPDLSSNPNLSSSNASLPLPYSRVVSWIDEETGGIVHAEAYDAKGELLKVFEPKSFKKVNGQWELQEMEIRNVQTGSRTRLEFDLKK